MSTVHSPATIEELVATVRDVPQLLPVGARTKPRLAAFDGSLVSTARLSGITEYDASEFTFTALAGTPVREIAAALAEKGQYLPFDPCFVAGGGTLAGTVASGLSGPGRFRYGGVRDFILGIRFVDGEGRLLRMGGKVVKNAAGFDLPKFFVGSFGRFGVLAEITFKVFPRPASLLTLKLPVPDAATAATMMMAASHTRWELDALEYAAGESAVSLRLGGPAEANASLAREILDRWPGETLADASAFWDGINEFRWVPAEHVLVKVPTTPKHIAGLCSFDGARCHVGIGGNVVYLAVPPAAVADLDLHLRAHHAAGVTLRGEAPLRLGQLHSSPIEGRIKAVLDPQNRFPSL